MVAGVAAALGRHFDLDPALIRVAFVVLTFFGLSGAAIYVVLALIVPSEDAPARIGPGSTRTRKVVLAGLVVLAIVWLPFTGPGLIFAGPAILTVAVLGALGVLLWRAVGGDADASLTRGALIVLAVGGSLMLGAGAAVAAAFGGGTVVAGVVLVTGAALVVGGLLGGGRWLVVPALLLAVPPTVVAAADIDLRGGVGEREYRPVSVADLETGYDLGAGELRIDLRDLDLPAGETPLELDAGLASVELVVPEDVCVQTSAHAGIGHIEVFGRVSEGIDVDLRHRPEPVGTAPVLVVDAEVGVGEIVIGHEPSDHWFGRDRDRDSDHAGDGQAACRS